MENVNKKTVVKPTVNKPVEKNTLPEEINQSDKKVKEPLLNKNITLERDEKAIELADERSLKMTQLEESRALKMTQLEEERTLKTKQITEKNNEIAKDDKKICLITY